MITLKLILAVFLSAIPFVYAMYIRPKQKKSDEYANFFTWAGRHFPRLGFFFFALKNFLRRLHEGMKRSDTFRKFFHLVALLFLLGFQYVDYSASTAALKTIRLACYVGPSAVREAANYSHLVTLPPVMLLSATLALFLFSYGIADRLLTVLHNSRKIFFFSAVSTLFLTIFSTHFFILSETMEIILMSAVVYPNKNMPSEPKGRRPLPYSKRDEKTNRLVA